MPARPSTRLKVVLRAALRRRYGYAALRKLRLGLARAVEEHHRRTYEDPRPYDGQAEEDRIYLLYWRGLQRLRQRWPDLNLEDPRADP
jgi:hypothetical protein